MNDDKLSDGTEHCPSAGDSRAIFAGNQPPSCDEADCNESVDYLSQRGAFCEYHAWTNGVQRRTPGGKVNSETSQEEER